MQSTPVSKSIRVVIVDDHPVVCSGLANMLRAHPNLEVSGSASNGERALHLARTSSFDVMLLDLRMPGMDGLAVLEHLKSISNPPKVLILSSFAKEEDIYRAIRAGAQGYLLKDSSEAEILNAISTVVSGKRYIPRDIAARLADRMLKQDLTSRELGVLELLSLGYTNKEIASALGISDSTVRVHVNNIMEKLQVSDRTEAVANALRKGVLAGFD